MLLFIEGEWQEMDEHDEEDDETRQSMANWINVSINQQTVKLSTTVEIRLFNTVKTVVEM